MEAKNRSMLKDGKMQLYRKMASEIDRFKSRNGNTDSVLKSR